MLKETYELRVCLCVYNSLLVDSFLTNIMMCNYLFAFKKINLWTLSRVRNLFFYNVSVNEIRTKNDTEQTHKWMGQTLGIWFSINNLPVKSRWKLDLVLDKDHAQSYIYFNGILMLRKYIELVAPMTSFVFLYGHAC